MRRAFAQILNVQIVDKIKWMSWAVYQLISTILYGKIEYHLINRYTNLRVNSIQVSY